ncbi:MAG: cytochrome C [Phycisphaerales bacterium]|nr:cytochrome C [Phycisphaerae bacterium]NNF42600.1 cytochrome C [Phycisphaerales bacterium]NNM26769.1 cytochrome C [Phycisphaerales bacterium]
MAVGRWLKMICVGSLAIAISQVPGPQTPPPGTPLRPSGPLPADSCRVCHGELAAHDVLHGPVGVNACNACHREESVEQHTYSLARPGVELCTFCHDMTLEAASVHEPLMMGDCTGCHDPHGGRDRTMLKAASVDELCASCHGDVLEAGVHRHGPAAAGACSVCHEPHVSMHPALLTAPPRDLCLECHVATGTQLETMRVVHGPAMVDCGVCHDAHASDHPMMLREEPQTLCLGCHETIRHAVEEANTQHSAVTSDRQCLNCHDPHGSDHPRVLRTDMRSLCFECHDRPIELPDGTTLGDIKTVIESGTSLHGPVAQDNCAACHMIHGGDNFRMLVQEYPPEFYAPFAEEQYALCFSCHDKQLVVDARTTSLTDFRNGDLNLHHLHVNRDKKGRTCRACHETHASHRDKHIRDSVPFGSGGWELPIGYQKSDTGGSCAPGCHRPYDYDRVTPLVYPESDRAAIWPSGTDDATPPDHE